MRLAAALASLAILAAYLMLMPLYGFGLTQPRGGIVSWASRWPSPTG